jgi:cytochrome c553
MKRAHLLLVPVLVLGLTSARADDPSYNASYSDYYDPSAPKVLSVEEFESLAEKAKGKGLEFFLSELSSKKPEFMQGNVLIYKSKSPILATPKYPRVLLFTNGSPVVLAYGGNPAQKDHKDQLEAMINVKGPDGILRPVLKKYNFSAEASAKGQFKSKPNPTECVGCHGANAKPIIDPYPLWSGWYGSIDGTVLSDAVSYGQRYDQAPHAGELKKEGEFFQTYVKTYDEQKAAQSGVYRFLPDPNGSDGILKVGSKVRTLQSVLGQFNQGRILDVFENPKLFPFRYAILGAALECNNIVHYADPNYKSPISGFPIDEFLSPSAKSSIQGSLKDYQEDSDRKVMESILHRVDFYKLALGSSNSSDNIIKGIETTSSAGTLLEDITRRNNQFIAPLRYVVEGNGIPMNPLFLQNTVLDKSFELLSAFEERRFGLFDLGSVKSYITDLSKKDPSIKDVVKYFENWNFGGDRIHTEQRIQACQDLQKRSLAATKSIEPSKDLPKPCFQPAASSIGNARQLMETTEDVHIEQIIDSSYGKHIANDQVHAALHACVRCHSIGGAPHLPFDKPQEFTKEQLAKIKRRISDQSESQGEQRMPFGLPPLSNDNQKEFIKMLQGAADAVKST